MSKAPIAFFSYSHDDDEQDGGRLTRIRERLQGEVSMQWGDKVEIFQDLEMHWGVDWDQRIKSFLDATIFLIPVVTPRYLKRPACRAELERFIERETALGRNDLILPFYYLNARALEVPELRQKDPLAEVLASRQRVDWRSLRHEPETTPEFGKALMRAAEHIVDALHRDDIPSASPASAPARTRDVPSTAKVQSSAKAESGSRGVSPKEPPTVVVDWMKRGDFDTIGSAIEAAEPGTRILVRPGTYREGLVIDKPLEILGDGKREDIVVEAKGKNAVLFKSTMGRIANLTLRQRGGGDWYCVDVTQGRLDLSDCDISSDSHACIAIHDGAAPVVRRNRIHDGKQGGVLVHSEGRGTIEDNEITGNAYSGIEIQQGADPVVRRNRIHNGKQGGVIVHLEGRGTIEDNEITGNAYSGIEIKQGADPVVRRNRIHDGKKSGVFVHSEGRGTIEDNEITRNGNSGVVVQDSGNPTVRNNRITNNKYFGVYVESSGMGTFEGNTLEGNGKGPKIMLGDADERVIWWDNVEK